MLMVPAPSSAGTTVLFAAVTTLHVLLRLLFSAAALWLLPAVLYSQASALVEARSAASA